KTLIAQTEQARTSLRLDDVAGRFWQEHGQHGTGAVNTERRLALMIEFFGKDKLLTEITGDDVARLVAWRRGIPAKRLGPSSPITPSSICWKPCARCSAGRSCGACVSTANRSGTS